MVAQRGEQEQQEEGSEWDRLGKVRLLLASGPSWVGTTLPPAALGPSV